jgi:hypothetical protein
MQLSNYKLYAYRTVNTLAVNTVYIGRLRFPLETELRISGSRNVKPLTQVCEILKN